MNHRPAQPHPLIVRATHWITAAAALALIVSGTAILLAHPRLYWGETGAVGGPSLIDLPIPFLLGHSGWGRYLHFLAAWVSVLTGLVYLGYGIFTRHFRSRFVPARGDLAWASLSRVASGHLRRESLAGVEPGSYNVLQRLVYVIVVFVLGPLVLLSGLAFSPALAAVMPALVTMFGGQQSARTIHFFGALAVVLFIVLHVVMVWRTGFRRQTRAMTIGAAASAAEQS